MNRSWGFNPRTHRIWVDEGCSGIFADNTGYHHGKTNTYDKGARSYDSSGRDAGLLVGALLGVAILSEVDDNERKDRDRDRGRDHYNNNRNHNNKYDSGYYNTPEDYDGCHGIGCLVDNPDD